MTDPSAHSVPLSPAAVGEQPARSVWQRVLHAGAEAWDVSPATMRKLFAAPCVVALAGVAAALASKSLYKLLVDEDGVFEWGQVGFYFATWVLCLFVLRHHFQVRNKLIGALYVVLAVGLVFLMGEEVSWGQRIVGWETPAAFTDANKQDETNLHNIHGVGHAFKWVQLLVGAYGTILPLVFLRPPAVPRLRPLIDAVVPHFTLIPYFLPMFVWKLYRNLFEEPTRFYYAIARYNEVIELILAMGFCLFLVFQWRKCRRERAETTAEV
jgi:hypothetical protein